MVDKTSKIHYTILFYLELVDLKDEKYSIIQGFQFYYHLVFRSYDEYLKQMDIWVVMPQALLTKEVRYLNKILGVRGLNHLGNKKGFCNKKRLNSQNK